jgi:DNA repair exonuclease SbcCD ATPase subunit
MDSAQQVDALKAEIEQVRSQLAEVEPLVRTAQVDHDSVLRATQQVTERLKEAKQCQADYQNAKLRLESAERKLEEFRAAASRDNAAQKEEAIKKLKIVLRSATSAVLASGVCHEAAMRATHSMTAAKMKEDCLLARTERFKNKLSEEMNATQHLEKQFNELTRSFNEIKARTLCGLVRCGCHCL